MDWTLYFILATAVTSISLTWRMVLLDHPRLDKALESIPYIGNGLVCGFCVPMWLTLLFVTVLNPLHGMETGILGVPLVRFMVGWFSTATAVLFMRFSIVALFEGSGFLSHLHRESHAKKT